MLPCIAIKNPLVVERANGACYSYFMPHLPRLNQKKTLVLIGIVLLAQAGILFYMGQPPICTCDYVKVWEGVVFSSGNSQHLSDWYTFSHIIHGFLFYLFFWFLFPKSSIGTRLLLSLSVEVAWELAENTDTVINAYRETALAQGYTGDSIINSVFDSLAMIVGYLLAYRLPIAATVFFGLAMEAFVGYSIRDNLTLNILNFIYQFDLIRDWQSNLEQ